MQIIIDAYQYFYNIYEINKETHDYCVFLNKIIQKYNQSEISMKISNIILNLETAIEQAIDDKCDFTIASKYFDNNEINDINENKSEKKIIISSYHQLKKEISNINIKSIDVISKIEKHFILKAKNILSVFANLLIIRNACAIQNRFPTYYTYITKKNDNGYVKKFINMISKKIQNGLRKELLLFASDNNLNKNVKISDTIIKLNHQKMKTIFSFSLSNVLNAIFYVFNKYFSIIIKKNTIDDYYNIQNDKNLAIGKLIISSDFNSNITMIVKISDNIENLMSVFAFITHKDKISYDEVNSIFRDFGSIVPTLITDKKKFRIGITTCDIEFSSFFSSLFEYFLFDKDVYKILNPNSNSNNMMYDKYIITKKKYICYYTIIKCINTKFDHFIHNSVDIINILKNTKLACNANFNNLNNENKETAEELTTCYMTIFNDVIKDDISNLFETETKSINFQILSEQISRNHGIIYSDMVCETMACCVYLILTNNYIPCHSLFKTIVLTGTPLNYRTQVGLFLKKMNINIITTYCKFLLNEEIIIDNLSDCENMFIDESNSESESESESESKFNSDFDK